MRLLHSGRWSIGLRGAQVQDWLERFLSVPKLDERMLASEPQ